MNERRYGRYGDDYDDQSASSRYDRSRYGSSSSDDSADSADAFRRSARRGGSGDPDQEPAREPYYDNFFEDMRITDEEPRSEWARRGNASGTAADEGQTRRARRMREGGNSGELPVRKSRWARKDDDRSEGSDADAEEAEARRPHRESEGRSRRSSDDRAQETTEDAQDIASCSARPSSDDDEQDEASSRRPRYLRDDQSRETADDVRSRTSRPRRPSDVQREGDAKPKRSKGRVAAIVVSVVAALVLVGAGAAFAYMNTISSNLHEGVDQNLRDALVQTDMAKEPFYMLLLGTDGSAARDEDPELAGVYRSDSMMLARVDAPNKKVTLISINRDTMVDLGGEYGEQKINAAYGIGGPAMAVQAVSKLTGVDISHYAQVDFDAFSALVDALGGVEVEVPIDIDDWEAGGAVSAGLQTLNGEQALILCRSRNAYAYTAAHPDQMRAANQRLVISAIAKKLLSSDIATIANSVQALSQYVTTDLDLTDIIGLAQAMQGLNPETDIYTAMEPTNSEYVDDTWVEYLNKEEWSEMIKRVNAGLPPTEERVIDEATGTVIATAGSAAAADAPKYSTITVKNGSGIQGLAAKTRTKLMDAGFSTVIIGDIAEGYEYPMTLVVYNDANGQHEAEEIVGILGQGSAFLNDGSYLLADTDYLVIIGEDWVE